MVSSAGRSHDPVRIRQSWSRSSSERRARAFKPNGQRVFRAEVAERRKHRMQKMTSLPEPSRRTGAAGVNDSNRTVRALPSTLSLRRCCMVSSVLRLWLRKNECPVVPLWICCLTSLRKPFTGRGRNVCMIDGKSGLGRPREQRGLAPFRSAFSQTLSR